MIPLLGLFLVNCLEFSKYSQLTQVSTKPWLLLVWLCGLMGFMPLIWRGSFPVTVFVVQWVFAVAAWPILSYYTPVVGTMVALYAVSVHRGWKSSLLALLASFVPYGLDAATVFRTHRTFAGGLSAATSAGVLFVLIAGGVWVSGLLVRASQKRFQKLEDERDEAKEAVAEQRRILARELHDIVSHAVTVMVIQAGSAGRIAETDCRQVLEPLADIERYGRRAMAELRRLLGVLDGAGRGELEPEPGLADLDELLSSLRSAGMLVTVHTQGTPGDLDASVDLAAYRIVQEGLTNVLRHAGKAANPRLRIAWQAQCLYLQIDNDANPTDTHRRQDLSCRRGLLGLNERARAVGGHLHAGPHQDGYRLTATLPLADTTQPTLLDHRPSPPSTAGMASSE